MITLYFAHSLPMADFKDKIIVEKVSFTKTGNIKLQIGKKHLLFPMTSVLCIESDDPILWTGEGK